MKRWITGILTVLTMTFLFGCGKSQTEEVTALSIEKNGRLEQTIVEDFSEAYYDEAGLKEYTLDTVAEHNALKGEKRIEVTTLEKAEESDAIVLGLKYQSWEDYQEFNGKTLFAGTVEEAYAAGLDLDITMQDAAEPEKTVGRDEILQMGERKLLIAEEAMEYRLPSKALYISDNAACDKKKVMKKSASDEALLYVIY